MPFRTRCKFTLVATSYTPKTNQSLDSPTEAAGGLACCLHPPALHILPLRLRAVKGRKLSPLTVLVCAAYGAQRDGSGRSRPAAGMSTRFESRPGTVSNLKNHFQTEDQLNFFPSQGLEEADETHHEFESTP